MKTRISDKTRLKRKLGTGEKESYRSFIKPRDFSANSRVHRISGHTIEREYVLLSDLERSFFYYFDFCGIGSKRNIKDIKEQIPLLPISETQSIAAECQIRHPRNEKGEDVIMTTDFLLTIESEQKDEVVAVSIKPSSKLTKRTIEKMQIEKKFWNSHNIRWVLLTEKQINKIENNNIVFLRDFFYEKSIDNNHSLQILEALTKQNLNSNLSIADFIDRISQALKITIGTARQSFYHLLARKQVRFDYTKSLNLDLPINELKTIQK